MLDKSYIYAVSAIIGTSVGAGIFSLPFVASKSGFFLFLALIFILGFIMLILGLMYAEITLRTKNKGRLVSYCEKYLGKVGKKIAMVVTLVSLYISMLAFIIIGGKFLNAIFSNYIGGDEFIYGIVIALFVSAGVYMSLKIVNVMELLMVIFLFVAIFGIIFKGIPYANVENLLTFDVSQSFFPFGAILFSVGALSAIPMLEHIMKKNQKKIKNAIITGSIITVVIHILFAAVVLGVTGSATSQEALYGLSLVMKNGIVQVGLIFGVFAIATSFLIIGINLKEVFWYDYHLSEKKSWALACFVPIIVFLLGFRDFITVISIAGSVMGCFVGILIIASFYKAKKMGDLKPAFEIKIPIILSFFIVIILLFGVLSQFVYEI
ncbi:MAG: aromatic amino acid transport family protein [Patescibacteria group bacterium]|nr:aromatic amino acid transport family protein [Patescibacteria group bacterium]